MMSEARNRNTKVQRLIKEAIDELNAIIIDHCEGYDDYIDDYQEKQAKALRKLVKVQILLA